MCELYWYPLYAYLRRRGYTADDAQDLTQAFFTRMLEKGVLRHADPARGRFRSFLLTALQHFVINEHEHDRALKRGGGEVFSLDFSTAEGRVRREPATEATPESVYDRAWAVTLVERAVAQLRAEFTDAGKGDQYAHLEPYLAGERPNLSYAAAAPALGMSEGALKVAVHRMRRRFRELLHDEIAQTVSSPDEIEDEIRYLLRTLGR